MGILRYDRLIKESKEELEELLKKERDVRVYKRIKVIYLLKKTPKIQLKDVSEKLDINVQTVKKYWELYKKGGIENLKLKYKGRIPRLNKEEFNKELSIKTISYWCKKLGIKKKGQTFKYQ